jgi:hypothetical protein
MKTEIPRITVAEVRALLDRGEPVTFVDARSPSAWADSAWKLPRALRMPADAVEASLPAERLKQPIVAYCT